MKMKAWRLTVTESIQRKYLKFVQGFTVRFMPSVNKWQNNSDPQGSNILSAVKKTRLLCSQLCLQKLQGSLHVA